AAEPLLAAALGLPHPQAVLAGDDPERAFRGVRVRRRRRAAAPLAALAVAVARHDERRGHLVADGAAVAAAGEGELCHLHNRTFSARSQPARRTVCRYRP